MTIGRIPSVEGGIQPTIVDAKGDLIAGVAADSINRLAVGSNDQVLVADSSTSTGLAWKSVATPFAAGKNKIINGDFNVWQRGTSFTGFTSGTYTSDRWACVFDGTGATRTISQQAFTAGTAPVSGYEGAFFLRFNQSVAGTGGNFNVLLQRIEDGRTFAGQTVVVSFWAKAATNGTTMQANFHRNYGSGGSATDFNILPSAPSYVLTTSWVRYTATVSIPSASGKTFGPGSYLEFFWYLPINTTSTIDIWGVQIEAGNVATPFQTATGTLQGELAACQRYYYRHAEGNAKNVTNGFYYNASEVYGSIQFPVTMRTAPTLDVSNTTDYFIFYANNGSDSFNTFNSLARATTTSAVIGQTANVSGTTGQAGVFATNNASAQISFTAEL